MGDAREEIMDATFQAFLKHGYADLSIQKIADEFDKGKSLIYYHFDDKEDLMLSFLDNMTEKVVGDLKKGETDTENRIDIILDKVVGIDSEEQWEFRKAFQEFRVQAQHNKKFRKKFEKTEKLFLEETTDIMRENGAKDPEIEAEIFLSLIEGAVSRKIVVNDRKGLEDLKEDIKKAFNAYSKDCRC